MCTAYAGDTHRVRVELGEIEAAINRFVGIRQSKVVCVDKKNLIAFYCENEQVDRDRLKKYLKKVLPLYMVPIKFEKINILPQSKNGKIDVGNLYKRALAISKDKHIKSKKEPITAEERKLAIIWQRVLEGENVSVYDNFFSCGGNSLKAIQLVNEINKDFQKQIAINELFENSTIEKLAKLLTTATDELESDEQEEGFL